VRSTGQVGAFVIKWKPQSEIDAERTAVEKLEKRFKDEHPDLNPTREFIDLVTEYCQWLGSNLEHEDGAKKWDEILTEILTQSKDAETSKWLFKGTIKSGGLTSSFTELVYGIASISRKDENATIVSGSGKVDLNFSGTVKDG